jgi:hypothetical protein
MGWFCVWFDNHPAPQGAGFFLPLEQLLAPGYWLLAKKYTTNG